MKKKTVKIKADYIEYCLGANGWSNAHFCTNLMGKGRGWITEWKRDRNLPSPEEAARMCILLNTTPEEILLHEGANEAETAKCQADIELVRGLVEQERAEGAKKERPADAEALPNCNILRIAGRDGSLIEKKLSDEQVAALKGIIDQFQDADDDL